MGSPLANYFSGVGIKRLSLVEAAPDVSNQHEINGINELRNIFGSEKRTFKTKFIYLTDQEDKSIEGDGFMTWYDARENHPTRTEYRLYYSSNEIMSSSKADDLVVVALTKDSQLAVIVSPKGSTSEKQILWLFGVEEAANKFIVKDLTGSRQDIGYAGRYIINSLGIETDEIHSEFLDELVSRFGMKFPTTKEFSEYARSTVNIASPIEEPDVTLLAWMEREEVLFKTLEKVIVKQQLLNGFGADGTDVEEFIKLSLSIQNRRKARAGFAFENNLAVLFTLNDIRYSHGAVTERNNKPDFIFPDIKDYHSESFNTELLSMLGVKTSAKDRWRQVLSEASKIQEKHLITLEPAISRNQTEEMFAHKLQLVIPSPLHTTYSAFQQQRLMTVRDFIDFIKSKQQKNKGFTLFN